MNNKKTKAYRHGELVLEVVDLLPTDLKEEKTTVLVKGATGNSHSFRGGKFYLKKESNFIFGYLEAKDTELYHPEHGDKKVGNQMVAKLPDGFYRLRKQQEWVNGELKQVVD